jgi:hypothetical protein
MTSRIQNLASYLFLISTLLSSMNYTRQTHLGLATAGNLTIVDRERPGVDLQPRNNYILQLPNELLSLIVEYACDDSDTCPGWEPRHTTNYDSNCVQSLSLVCHRFKSLAQPLLFRHIDLGYRTPIAPPSQKALKLHRALNEKAELRKHCR